MWAASSSESLSCSSSSDIPTDPSSDSSSDPLTNLLDDTDNRLVLCIIPDMNNVIVMSENKWNSAATSLPTITLQLESKFQFTLIMATPRKHYMYSTSAQTETIPCYQTKCNYSKNKMLTFFFFSILNNELEGFSWCQYNTPAMLIARFRLSCWSSWARYSLMAIFYRVLYVYLSLLYSTG